MRVGSARCAVLLLVVAGGLAGGGVAQAETVDGVTVPDVQLTAGTGDQIVDITISAGSPVVGSADQLAPSTEAGYAVGITAAGAGGSCTSFASAAWSCEPGSSGWRAGSIQLTISTAKATSCCSSLPFTLQIVGAGLPVDVDGSISIHAPFASPSAAPAGVATTAAAKTERSQPESAPTSAQMTKQTTTQPIQQVSPVSASSQSVASASASTSRSTAAAATKPVSPSTSAAAGRAASAAPSVPSLVDAADAKSSASSSPWILGGVAGVLILLAGAFAGWRRRVSRRRG